MICVIKLPSMTINANRNMNIMARDVINMSTPDAWSDLNQSTMCNDKKQRRFSGENRKSLQDALSCSP